MMCFIVLTVALGAMVAVTLAKEDKVLRTERVRVRVEVREEDEQM